MEGILNGLIGRHVDLTCSTNVVFIGTVVDVKEGVVSIKDEDERVFHVAIDKITAVSETKDHHSRPGFIA